jgi:hypothetical protein
MIQTVNFHVCRTILFRKFSKHLVHKFHIICLFLFQFVLLLFEVLNLLRIVPEILLCGITEIVKNNADQRVRSLLILDISILHLLLNRFINLLGILTLESQDLPLEGDLLLLECLPEMTLRGLAYFEQLTLVDDAKRIHL